MGERGRCIGLSQFSEAEGFRSGAFEAQGHRFGHQDPIGQYRHGAFFAVCMPACACGDPEGDRLVEIAGYTERKWYGGGLPGGGGEILDRKNIVKISIYRSARFGIDDLEGQLAGQFGICQIGDLRRQGEHVAFPQESRRVGLDHQVFLCDDRPRGRGHREVLGMRQHLPFPTGQCLGHDKAKANVPEAVRFQIGEKEGRLPKVFADLHGEGSPFFGGSTIAHDHHLVKHHGCVRGRTIRQRGGRHWHHIFHGPLHFHDPSAPGLKFSETIPHALQPVGPHEAFVLPVEAGKRSRGCVQGPNISAPEMMRTPGLFQVPVEACRPDLEKFRLSPFMPAELIQ